MTSDEKWSLVVLVVAIICSIAGMVVNTMTIHAIISCKSFQQSVMKYTVICLAGVDFFLSAIELPAQVGRFIGEQWKFKMTSTLCGLYEIYYHGVWCISLLMLTQIVILRQWFFKFFVILKPRKVSWGGG